MPPQSQEKIIFDATQYTDPILTDILLRKIDADGEYGGGIKDEQIILRNLSRERFDTLFSNLAGELESTRIPIDYDSTEQTWVIQRNSRALASVSSAWSMLIWTEAIPSTLTLPPSWKRHIYWDAGQPDTYLRSLAGEAGSCKTPGIAVCVHPGYTRTIVGEADISENMEKLHLDAKRWLKGTCNVKQDTGVQCVLLFRIHPEAIEAVEKSVQQQKDHLASVQEMGPGTDSQSSGHGIPEPSPVEPIPATGTPTIITPDSYKLPAFTIEVWRNSRSDNADRQLILSEPTASDPPSLSDDQRTIPVCVSRCELTMEELVNKIIPEFRDIGSPISLQHLPPLPRNRPQTNPGSTYETSQKGKADAGGLTYNEQYFTLYLEDAITQSEVPKEWYDMQYVNIPAIFWVRLYLRSEDVGFQARSAPKLADNDANLEPSVASETSSEIENAADEAM